MTTRICDFCGAVITDKNKVNNFIQTEMLLVKDSGSYQFTIDIGYTANFCTTGMDWCKDCFNKALKIAIDKL